MLITKGNREDAIHALINVWLKDKTRRCGWCGAVHKFPPTVPCCEQPFIATNLEIMEQFHNELKRDRQTRLNEFASTKAKRLRWTLSFPPGLLQFLQLTFKVLYKEELFNNKYNLAWFARKFRRYFTVPERV